jgi:outer membrane receptor protein involved in Fe transport
VENQGAVRSEGLELESQARVTDDLTLTLSGSYTNAFADGAIPNAPAASGDRVPFFPRTIISAGADYVTHLPVGRIKWSVDYTYRSNAFTEFSPDNPLQREIPASVNLNGSINYLLRQWEFAVYGTNLTNNLLVSEVQPNLYPGLQPGDEFFVGRPRTIGVHVRRSF